MAGQEPRALPPVARSPLAPPTTPVAGGRRCGPYRRGAGVAVLGPAFVAAVAVGMILVQARCARYFELAIAALLVVVAGGFAYDLAVSPPDPVGLAVALRAG